MPQTLNEWVERVKTDTVVRDGMTTSWEQRVKDRSVSIALGNCYEFLAKSVVILCSTGPTTLLTQSL